MKVTIAAKRAVILLMTMALAVAMVACQGAVGPTGDKGDKGDKGDPGTDGTQGPQGPTGDPGFTSLQVKGTGPYVIINDIDGDDADELKNEAGPAITIDLTDYFRGGMEPFMFGTPERPAAAPGAGPLDVERVDDGPMYKFSVPENQGDEVGLNTWSVTITDGEMSTVAIDITARRNDAPEGDAAVVTAIVGTQMPAEAPDMVPACPAADECTSESVDFTDDDPGEELAFDAMSANTGKVQVVSAKAEGTDADALNAVVVVRGIASTWAEDATPDDDTQDDAGHIPVEVTVTATDRGDETAERTLNVTVDGAPVASPMPNGTISGDATTYVVANVAPFFKDPEGETLSFAAESSSAQVATVGDITEATGVFPLTVTKNAAGTATITVTATEVAGDGPEQTAKVSFTVTVR